MAGRGSAKKRSPPHILADEHFEPIRNPVTGGTNEHLDAF